MSIIHKNITDPDVHEPKGVSTASAGSVYVADGAGSGAWMVLRRNLALTGEIKDLGTTAPARLVVPTQGTITLVTYVSNSANSNHVIEIIHNGNIVGSFTVTNPNEGDVITQSISVAVVPGDLIEIRSDGQGLSGSTAGVGVMVAEDLV